MLSLKPKLFSKNSDTFPEEEEFNRLVREVSEDKPKFSLKKLKPEIKPSKELAKKEAKKPKEEIKEEAPKTKFSFFKKSKQQITSEPIVKEEIKDEEHEKPKGFSLFAKLKPKASEESTDKKIQEQFSAIDKEFDELIKENAKVKKTKKQLKSKSKKEAKLSKKFKAKAKEFGLPQEIEEPQSLIQEEPKIESVQQPEAKKEPGFLFKIGLLKTEEEKQRIAQQKEQKRQEELARKEELRKQKELENQEKERIKQEELQKKEELKRQKEIEKKQKEESKNVAEKTSLFGKLSRKKPESSKENIPVQPSIMEEKEIEETLTKEQNTKTDLEELEEAIGRLDLFSGRKAAKVSEEEQIIKEEDAQLMDIDRQLDSLLKASKKTSKREAIKEEPEIKEAITKKPKPIKKSAKQLKEEVEYLYKELKIDDRSMAELREKSKSELEDLYRQLGLDQEKPKKSGKMKEEPLDLDKELETISKKSKKSKKLKEDELDLDKELENLKEPSAIKEKEEALDLDKELGLEDFDFEMPKKAKGRKKYIELPETLELEEPFAEQKQKPKELEEAKEEIKSAIEKIKEHEKPSFFKKLFSMKHKVEEHVEHPIQLQRLPEADSISVIQNYINGARQALMKFDLQTAKKGYIEAMKVYNSLNPEEQAKVYNEIRDLYFERKSAEELKV